MWVGGQAQPCCYITDTPRGWEPASWVQGGNGVLKGCTLGPQGLGEYLGEKPRIIGEKGGWGVGYWGAEPRASLSRPVLPLPGLGQESNHVAQQVWFLPSPPTLCPVHALLIPAPWEAMPGIGTGGKRVGAGGQGWGWRWMQSVGN